MEVKIPFNAADFARMELRYFVSEGVQDALDNKLLDFDSTFDELEERFGAND